MPKSITAQVRALQQMTLAELREKWAEVFGEETQQRHRTYLWKRIAWKIQGDHYVGLTGEERAQVDMYRDEFRRMPPDQWFPGGLHNQECKMTAKPDRDPRLPPTGSAITRMYRGDEIVVTIRGDGFEYRGLMFRSLSAVAKTITGTNWNGYTFFGLSKEGRQ